MSLRTRIEIRYAVYLMLTLLILFSPALAGLPPTRTTLNIPSDFDASNLFRLAVAALVGVLIWISRRADIRLSRAEDRIAVFNEISAVRGEKIELIEGQIKLLIHEQAQLESVIGMLRETLLTKYDERTHTERHRLAVEEKLQKQGDTLIAICHRLDFMARPLHRATDDQINEYARRAHDAKTGD